MQDVARHADPRTTRRYDRARGALDWHATYELARYLAGSTGNPRAMPRSEELDAATVEGGVPANRAEIA